MSDAVETYRISKTKELRIFYDDSPINPREDCEPITKMVCFHSRYKLGDGHGYFSEEHNNWEELKEQLEEDYDILVIRPLYLFDHSGLTISTTPFGCRWDSGQIGWVFVEKGLFIELPELFTEKALKLLEDEVEEYDTYLRGDVYGFQLVEESACEACGIPHEEVIDSCWGFYGSDIKENGILDNLSEEDRESILSQV